MKTLFLTLGFLVLVSANVLTPASADTADSPLSMDVSLNQESYAWNDTLTSEVRLQNTDAQHEVNLSFPDSCYFDTVVQNEAGEVLIEEETMCAQVITEVPVAAGGVWTVSETLELDGLAGLPAGTYWLMIENNASAKSNGTNYDLPSQKVSFTLDRPLLIDYELDQEDYVPGESVEISYTIENQGGETFSFNAGGCHPYVSFYDATSGELLWNEEEMVQDCTDDKVTIEVEPYESYSGSTSVNLEEVEADAGVYQLALNFNTNSKSNSFYLLGDGFSDITDHWAESYIQELYLEGVVEGYSMHWFKPDQAITRAEFLKILFGAMHLELSDDTNLDDSAFSDVSEEDWSFLYTQSAYEQGLVSGYEDGTFAPSQSITRAEATAMVLSSIGIQSDEIPSRSNVFTDVSAEWQIRVIMEAYVRDIVDGYYNEDEQPNWSFGPNDPLTRAEACKLVVEARKN